MYQKEEAEGQGERRGRVELATRRRDEGRGERRREVTNEYAGSEDTQNKDAAYHWCSC